MAEMIAPKRKSRKSKVLDEVIPDLPDLNLIEIDEKNDVEVKISNNIKENCVFNKIECEIMSVDKLEEKLEDVSNCKSVNIIKQIPEIKPDLKHVNIEKLYPSLTVSLNFPETVINDVEQRLLETVTERITRPLVPVEEWTLPEPLSQGEMKTYYQNLLLNNLEQYQLEFNGEMQDSNHPLAELILAYQRSVRKLCDLEQKLKITRDDCGSKERSIWTVVPKTGWREAKCRDNLVVKKSYSYQEASFSSEIVKQLENKLHGILNQSLDDHTLLKYECGLYKALVEDYLFRVKKQGINALTRQCLCVLFRFLRQIPVNKDCSKVLQDWILYLGDIISTHGSNQDRLHLFWQLLHSPAGVGEWSARLIQSDNTDLVVAYLAMLLGSQKIREDLLKAWSPGLNGEETSWALVDSEGEDDDSIGNSWFLLRESDLIAFLGQIPIGNAFKVLLEVESDNENYDPGRSCHPGKLMRLMAFSQQIISILDRGLENYSNNRYKTINKRTSRLIKHTIQFLTDHLEAVLATSAIPKFDHLFAGNTRLKMLSQYETLYEYALISLIRHRRHGTWQTLADLPWRMLSPNRKWCFLTYLIDYHQKDIPSNYDWWLTNLQLVIDQICQDDAIYLLTAISNLGLESRPIISREQSLLTTITELIFQICYVIPSTRSSFSKFGRDLLSSLCLQYPQTLSTIIESIKLWHPTVGQMGLFLFRELPFCLMIPTENEFRLLSSWLLENPPNSVCNQLARHIFTNLNWGFSNEDETVLYLPLSLHQRMAVLLVNCFKKHMMDNRSGHWFINESIKLVTYLWWNQEAVQDQSFHTWCVGLSFRLRLNPVSYRKINSSCTMMPSIYNTSDWVQSLADAQQERCSHPIAMYMAVTTSKDFYSTDSLKIIQNLVVRHQQYRLCLELFYQIIMSSIAMQFTLLTSSDIFMMIWKQVVHADDSYYNLVKSLITKQFPGPVLTCIGNSFCSSLVLINGEKEKQEITMEFFLRSVLNQQNWHSDQSFLWLLDKLLELNTSLDLKTGWDEMYSTVKHFNEKQFSDASKRSGFAQIFRLGNVYNPLINQLATGDFMWLKSYLLEVQTVVEDEMNLWSQLLHKLFIRKKREPRSLTSAINSACKHLRLGLSVNINGLVLIQAAQTLASCPPDHLSLIKIAAVFFQRYLGFGRVWNKDLNGMGSAGHKIFQDDACHPFLQQARSAISAAKIHHSAKLDSLKQANSTNIALYDHLQNLCDKLEMFLLWIDEPRLHLEDMVITGLPSQYRADLLNLARLAKLSDDSLNFPRRLLLDQSRQSASAWDTRNDLDLRFVRLANSLMNKPVVPLATKIFQRFKRQLSMPTLTLLAPIVYNFVEIPTHALSNTTQLLEFISEPLSIMYQSAAKQEANRNFLSDLDRKYISAISNYYDQNSVNETVRIPCNRGPHGCTGHAVLIMNHYTWNKRIDICNENSRNRQDYNQLIDEILKFSNLDKLVKGVVCIKQLILELDAKLQLAKNEEMFKKIVDCGLALFFHLGRQINAETQKYPPHHIFVSEIMSIIGTKFMPYASNQASTLLKGMIENDLLVEVYCPHFCPNADTSQTSNMLLEVMKAYETSRCSSTVICKIIDKFNMKKYLQYSPIVTSKLNMIDALIIGLSYAKAEINKSMEMDNKIEDMHVNNLKIMLLENFTTSLHRVLDGFRNLCEQNKLRPRFWSLILDCIQNNIHENGELVMTIEEIRNELEIMGTWLNKLRFNDSLGKKNGLYIKLGEHAIEILNIYGQLMEHLMFKLSRSAKENIVFWKEVVEKSWDLFLKIYIPWIQSFSIAENQKQTDIRLPWRIEDQRIADQVFGLAIERLNNILRYILNDETLSFYLHCILIWIANGLFLLKELPAIPYHETYCPKIKLLKWEYFKPSTDCVKLITELISRLWMSEQCKDMAIDICSRMQWTDPNVVATIIVDIDFISQIFELFVTIICRTKSVFKMESVDKLADIFIELDWNKLPSNVYKRGMEKLIANLEPRIILCNPSTIEGKTIKVLNHATGTIPFGDDDESKVDLAINKQTIYVNAVVKFLNVAFSFTQTKPNKNKNSGDDNQIKLFQLRINGLFSEIEAVVLQIDVQETRQKMAIAILSEVVQLFKNYTVALLAIEPVIGWLQESKSSPLILPLLLTLFRSTPHLSSMVRLAEELIETFILSNLSDGGLGSWATVNGYIRVDQELQQQYWKECVKQNCLLCLVQQIVVSISSIDLLNAEQWQSRIAEWIEQTRSQRALVEHSLILMIFLFLKFLLAAYQTSVKPSSTLKNFIQTLSKLSESKASAGFLGKVGLGKKSSFSFEFRMFCRSLSVFLSAQITSSNIVRVRPNDLGALTHSEMVISSRNLGDVLPTNKTLQNLEWLKSQRLYKDMSASTKAVLENNIAYICKPSHCIINCVEFVQQICRQLWPESKLLNLIYYL